MINGNTESTRKTSATIELDMPFLLKVRSERKPKDNSLFLFY